MPPMPPVPPAPPAPPAPPPPAAPSPPIGGDTDPASNPASERGTSGRAWHAKATTSGNVALTHRPRHPRIPTEC